MDSHLLGNDGSMRSPVAWVERNATRQPGSEESKSGTSLHQQALQRLACERPFTPFRVTQYLNVILSPPEVNEESCLLRGIE